MNLYAFIPGRLSGAFLRLLVDFYGLRRLCQQLSLLVLVFVMIGLGSCASIPRVYPAPEAGNYHLAQIQGFHAIRSYGDEQPAFLNELVEDQRLKIARNPSLRHRNDVLALSGGGADGAYGAGFLKGWTDRGDRPEFTLVTGVSTGALIAPFAFLGPQYDGALKRFYTETKSSNIFIAQPLTALFGGSALVDPAPLKEIIKQEVSATMVRALAREYGRGRMLLIGTTNLDAQRQVIWNIGRIAASGHPKAAELIRQILLASASIPGAFPPVAIDVVIDGKRYQELHVDGGVTHEIFAYPPAIKVRHIERQLGISPRKSFWLIRNTKINVTYRSVGLGVTDIAERSIGTLIKYQGRGDLIELERLARRDGFRFHLTAVPEDFTIESKEFFDPHYMGELYKVGYQAGISGRSWRTSLGDQFNLKPRLRRKPKRLRVSEK